MLTHVKTGQAEPFIVNTRWLFDVRLGRENPRDNDWLMGRWWITESEKTGVKCHGQAESVAHEQTVSRPMIPRGLTVCAELLREEAIS